MAGGVDPRLLRASNVFGTRAAGQQGQRRTKKGRQKLEGSCQSKRGEEVARRYHVQ